MAEVYRLGFVQRAGDLSQGRRRPLVQVPEVLSPVHSGHAPWSAHGGVTQAGRVNSRREGAHRARWRVVAILTLSAMATGCAAFTESPSQAVKVGDLVNNGLRSTASSSRSMGGSQMSGSAAEDGGPGSGASSIFNLKDGSDQRSTARGLLIVDAVAPRRFQRLHLGDRVLLGGLGDARSQQHGRVL